MIGQKALLNEIDLLISRKKFPQFVIIAGSKYSGRKTVAEYITQKLGAIPVQIGLSVDDVRKCEQISATSGNTFCFIMADADNMRPGTKSALLKMTEEPPKNAYFVVTLLNLNNFPDTLISRASVFQMLPYTQNEIASTFTVKDLQEKRCQDILQVAPSVGIAHILKNDTTGTLDFAHKIVEHIKSVSGANALKITTKIRTTNDTTGYDGELILQLVISIANRLSQQKDIDTGTQRMYAMMCKITANFYDQYLNVYKKKKFLLDQWILEMRRLL